MLTRFIHRLLISDTFSREAIWKNGKTVYLAVVLERTAKPSMNTSLDINWRDDNSLVTRPYK